MDAFQSLELTEEVLKNTANLHSLVELLEEPGRRYGNSVLFGQGSAVASDIVR